MFFSNQTDPKKQDGGFREGGVKNGEIGGREIEEGECEESFHCKSPSLRNIWVHSAIYSCSN